MQLHYPTSPTPYPQESRRQLGTTKGPKSISLMDEGCESCQHQGGLGPGWPTRLSEELQSKQHGVLRERGEPPIGGCKGCVVDTQ